MKYVAEVFWDGCSLLPDRWGVLAGKYLLERIRASCVVFLRLFSLWSRSIFLSGLSRVRLGSANTTCV